MNEEAIRTTGRVRGPNAVNYAEMSDQAPLTIGPRGDLSIAQGLPELTELVRLGESYYSTQVTPIAALTAFPTTTAGFSLYNGEPTTGKCYAIDSFGCVEVVTDATQQNSLALFAMNNVAPVATPADLAIGMRSLSGKKYSGRGRMSSVALTDDGWCPHGASSPGATAFAGAVWRVHEAFARGLYLVPPGGLFSVHAAKTVATGSQLRFFIRWHEVQLIWRA